MLSQQLCMLQDQGIASCQLVASNYLDAMTSYNLLTCSFNIPIYAYNLISVAPSIGIFSRLQSIFLIDSSSNCTIYYSYYYHILMFRLHKVVVAYYSRFKLVSSFKKWVLASWLSCSCSSNFLFTSINLPSLILISRLASLQFSHQ